MEEVRVSEAKSAFRFLTLSTIFLFLSLFGVVIWVRLDSIDKLHKIGKGRFEARFALCTEDNKVKAAVRGQLQKQINQGETFLKTHPHGTHDFSPHLIRQSIDNLKATRANLSQGDCQEFAGNPTLEVPTKRREGR